MNCCQCQGIEELFSEPYVRKELENYRAKGPDKTTRLLTEAIKEVGVEGLTLLDIGGGVGAVQHTLFDAGVQQATHVDASSAYIAAARSEARRRGLAGRVSHYLGDFVNLAPDIPPADVVTLDRVICCYPDMEKLVGLSTERARAVYGLVYPRDTWWIKLGLALGNFFIRLRRGNFRGFVHPTEAVDALVRRAGLRPRYYRNTFVWQIVVYSR